MGFKEFFGFRSKSDAQFSFTFPVPDGLPLPANDPRIAYLFGKGGISRGVALSIPAVARGVSQMTQIANLPLVTYRGNNVVVKNELLGQIDPLLPNNVTESRTIEDIIFEGVAYWEITKVKRANGLPVEARHIPVDRVTENPDPNSRAFWDVTSSTSVYDVWIDGVEVDPDTIIKFVSPRQPLLPALSQSVRQAVALAKTSEMYANNPTANIIFSPKADVDPDPDATRAALQDFVENPGESPYRYVGAALDVKPIELLTPVQLQLIQQNRDVMLAISNFFDMDPDDVGVETHSRTYDNAVARNIDRKNDQLSWMVQTIEQRLALDDVTPSGYFVKFDFDEFLRADPKTRAEVAQIEFQMGAITVDEYRESKGLPPLTDEQKSELKERAPIRVQATVGEPVKELESSFFSAEDVDATFAFESGEFSEADPNSRTVRALAVPYGEVSVRKSGRKYAFTKGSITYPENLKKIKLVRDHDYTQSVGYATAIEDTDAGLVVTFKVATGAEGDKALAGFIDGNYDAVSVGVDWDVEPQKDSSGIYRPLQARLKEVSQVAIPAFENARALSVQAASDNEGINMTDTTGAEMNAPEKTYTLAEFQALQASFGNSQGKEVKTPVSVQDDENVAPRELKANAQEKNGFVAVSEPGPYRFDGTEGRFDFSRDLIAAGRNDGDARKRTLEFMSEDFAVAVTNVTALNPTIQRPDLYVDEKYYEYPIWNTINKGSPPNGVNPFAWPKFATGTTLVADHVEGVEPTLGAFTVTNQTVTPTAVSGKVEINREVWDQGGSPQLSQLVRNQMHKAYAEALETASATFLDAQTLTDITLTTAAADSVLEGLLIDNLVALQITRGGYTMNNFLVHIDLYKALVKAKDSNNRRLFPAVNPQNATGSVTSKFAALNINGLVGVPAWALGASGTIAENSYLLDDEAIAGWATAPQDMTFDIQVKSVYVGLFGYKAFALRDTTGIRRFIYDPA